VLDDHFVAASDCERIRPGLITQPVNTATSLAYVVAGGAVAIRARQAQRAGHGVAFAGPLAGALVLNGLGSVAYHGPGGRAGKWLHDTGLVAVNATLAVAGAARLFELERRHVRVVDAALVAGAAGVLAIRPGAELALVAPLAAAAVAQELVRPTRPRGGRRLLGGLTLAAGAVVQARSRTGGVWCRPDGPFHGHGLWHLLSAIGLALVADAAVAEVTTRHGSSVLAPDFGAMAPKSGASWFVRTARPPT